ncbi:MAG: transcriptional antiterminator, BglG family [Clostridiaceae bacterium]|jgi:transcriptional antiterminator|nr:transcriptional antiterminator, BglG family [Clostridiaceae bacterium]
MERISNISYKVLKVFNNNVLLVNHANVEKILFGKGIGFGNKTGDQISIKGNIDKVFVIEDKENHSRFNQLVSTIDNKVIGLCEEMIYMIGKELNEDLNEKIHISLTDHIAFTLKRLKENDEIYNPFLVETETLYNKEFEVAKKAIGILEKSLDIEIPDGEIGFITLHIHSARNKGKLSNSVKYAFLCNSIVEIIEDSLSMEIDKQSLDYARFVTHIRFTIERIMKNQPIKNDLLDAIKSQYKNSYKLAKKVCKFIENELYVNVTEDEVAYIALHIEKFKSAC